MRAAGRRARHTARGAVERRASAAVRARRGDQRARAGHRVRLCRRVRRARGGADRSHGHAERGARTAGRVGARCAARRRGGGRSERTLAGLFGAGLALARLRRALGGARSSDRTRGLFARRLLLRHHLPQRVGRVVSRERPARCWRAALAGSAARGRCVARARAALRSQAVVARAQAERLVSTAQLLACVVLAFAIGFLRRRSSSRR